MKSFSVKSGREGAFPVYSFGSFLIFVIWFLLCLKTGLLAGKIWEHPLLSGLGGGVLGLAVGVFYLYASHYGGWASAITLLVFFVDLGTFYWIKARHVPPPEQIGIMFKTGAVLIIFPLAITVAITISSMLKERLEKKRMIKVTRVGRPEDLAPLYFKADEEGRSVIERLLKALGKKGTDIVAQRISECEEAEEKRALLALLTRMPATDTVKSLMSNMAKEKVEDKESGIDSESAGEIGLGGSSGDSDKSS